ncbi:DUF262 domain-containing HNH endonuclease family protein [uncultured Kordia sp.]|uniref:DUF262 domain-containing protein n=1 Tax=uncultured Kordia sp. TaxID=507699 RepID=UPI002632508B|nr:DUF262 domain-containing HNH endonuclease family protein [uncultured Kordia sp.]
MRYEQMDREPTAFNLRRIFDENYIIPLYQRNYAWQEREVAQLIQDIWDSGISDKSKNYYIGTLVVHKRKVHGKPTYEVIDGQQRLTTLNILLSVLKNEFKESITTRYESKLKFDSRAISSNTLKILADNHEKPSEKENSKMRQAYLDMSKKIAELHAGKKIALQNFKEYLFDKVQLLRVEVPEDTDLNHYFEIMNNRGEQLEKHEILKAELLEPLQNDVDATNAFAMIWDACANMERYVQYGFESDIRKHVFGKSWNKLPSSFECVIEAVKKEQKDKENTKNENESFSFLELAQKDEIAYKNETSKGEKEIRFNAVVTFPNFLLHVLRVYVNYHIDENDIPLDDKRLLITFKEVIDKEKDKQQFVKDFSLCLLQCKFLFDKYVLKREFKDNQEHWSLQRIELDSQKKPYYKKTFDSDQLIMLLSMFHVSFPQMIYKHWLNGALNYLYTSYDDDINENEYIEFLEVMSDAFYFDRFGENELSYFDIIYKNSCKPIHRAINEEHLHIGTKVQNFIFNRLDYLLWKSQVIKKENKYLIDNINSFSFSFRSSVEHFYPQNPKPGADLKIFPKDYLDRFGNLCLISRSKNSALSNYSPIAKAEHYNNSSIIESLKQRLMMNDSKNWDETAFTEHENKMINLLNRNTLHHNS